MLAIPQLKAKMAIRALTLHAAAAWTGLEKAKIPTTKTISEDMVNINIEEDGFCLGKNSTKKGTSF
jgi:hypothetical protein